MSIININKLAGMMSDKNHYTYNRVKNMLNGLKGKSSKKDIQQVRKIIQREFTEIDNVLAKLSEEQ
jgi:hypothetical protein